jgi:hypothetical protein
MINIKFLIISLVKKNCHMMYIENCVSLHQIAFDVLTFEFLSCITKTKYTMIIDHSVVSNHRGLKAGVALLLFHDVRPTYVYHP